MIMAPLHKPTIIDVKDTAQLGRVAADFFLRAARQADEPVVVLPTGNTPKPLYTTLRDHHVGDPLWQKLRYLQLDEYLGLPEGDERLFSQWIGQELLDPVHHPRAHRLIFNTLAAPADEVRRMRSLIEHLPRIELLVLGLGHNGHIGFNEPGASFEETVHLQDLSPETIAANADYWGGAARVPRRAITLGAQAFTRAAQTLLLVSGAGKHDALFRALNGPVTESCPASFLQTLPNVTIIADHAALDM